MKDTEVLFSPRVQFAPDFLSRVSALLLRLAAAREVGEGAGRSRVLGAGEEFASYRPYRPGEDLRQLDWNLLARLDRPFIRVTRREAEERWVILLDQSASMGVGSPGKLQLAAELTAALAAVGDRLGVEVQVQWTSDPDPRAAIHPGRSGLRALLEALEGREASGTEGLFERINSGFRLAGAGRLFLIGDLLDLELAQLAPFLGRGRGLALVQIFAPHELNPLAPEGGLRSGQAVRWWDPESSTELEVELSPESVAAFEGELTGRLEAWAQAANRHGFSFGSCSSHSAFEDVLTELFRGLPG